MIYQVWWEMRYNDLNKNSGVKYRNGFKLFATLNIK